MNLILFEPDEWSFGLPSADFRALHLIKILKLVPGDRFAAGELGRRAGTLRFAGRRADHLIFDEPEWTADPPLPGRVALLVGTPRPPTARRLLKDMTTMGVETLCFSSTALGDKSYLQSTLWKGDFREALKEGAAQARTTVLPAVVTAPSLNKALFLAEENNNVRVCLDGGGAPFDKHPLHQHAASGRRLWIAVGPERGWSDDERALFERRGWELASVGSRTLRTETACAVAVGTAAMKGWID